MIAKWREVVQCRHWRVMHVFSKLNAFVNATKMLHNARSNAHFVVLMPLLRFKFVIQ